MLHNTVQNKKSKTTLSEWYTFPKMGNHKRTSNHMYRLLMFSIRPHIYITAQEDIKCSICLRVTFLAITVMLKVRKVFKYTVCSKGLYITEQPFACQLFHLASLQTQKRTIDTTP